MKLNIQITILGHLSDAQFLMMRYKHEEAKMHIDFAKMLILKYGNTDTYVEEELLEELWSTLKDKTSEEEEKKSEEEDIS